LGKYNGSEFKTTGDGALLWVVERSLTRSFVYIQYHDVTDGRTELVKQYRVLHASA